MTPRRLAPTVRLTLWSIVIALAAFAFRPGSALAIDPRVNRGERQAADNIVHTVRNGENLLHLTNFYGVSASRIRAANPTWLDPNLITPGQMLVIPVAWSSTPSVTTPFFYTVQAGENSLAIALKFEIDHQALARANGSRFYPFAVQTGQTILVPAGPHLHRVLARETLNGIAAAFCTNADRLATANSLAEPGRLFVGQQILIPIQYNARPCARGVIPGTTASTTGAATGPSALVIRNIVFIEQVTLDPTRPGGAIARTRVEFRGGVAPFTLFNDLTLVGSGLIPGSRDDGGVIYSTLSFDQPATCPVILNHTFRLVSADGQSTQSAYFVGPFPCP